MVSSNASSKISHKVNEGVSGDVLPFISTNWTKKIPSDSTVQTVSHNEIISLSALITYVAHQSGLSEFRIERDLADRFSVANVKCLPAKLFDEATSYLATQISLIAAA